MDERRIKGRLLNRPTSEPFEDYRPGPALECTMDRGIDPVFLLGGLFLIRLGNGGRSVNSFPAVRKPFCRILSIVAHRLTSALFKLD
jgi:hypothetical protein